MKSDVLCGPGSARAVNSVSPTISHALKPTQSETVLPRSKQKSSMLTVYTASSFLERLRGLLARPRLNDTEALLISPCNDVHTVGMRYSIDVVFCNKEGEIIKTTTLAPFRFAVCREAACVIECAAGDAIKHGFKLGETVSTAITDGGETTPIGERDEKR